MPGAREKLWNAEPLRVQPHRLDAVPVIPRSAVRGLELEELELDLELDELELELLDELSLSLSFPFISLAGFSVLGFPLRGVFKGCNSGATGMPSFLSNAPSSSSSLTFVGLASACFVQLLQHIIAWDCFFFARVDGTMELGSLVLRALQQPQFDHS